MNKFFNQLFQVNTPYSIGNFWHFKLLELFIVGYTIKYAWEWAFYIQRNSEIVLPLGIANYIDVSFMFGYLWPILNASVISVLCIFSYYRIKFKWQYLLSLFLLHLQFAARFSQGEIPHSMNMVGMSLLALALGTYFFNKSWQVNRFTFGSIYFFVGLSYFSAAVSKLIGTGINWFDGRHLWLWMTEKSTDILSRTGTFEYNWLQELALEYWPIATLILLLGWLTEFSGVLMWWKKYRPYIATALIGMHFGITMTMNIRFDAYVYELLLIGYPWGQLFDRFISNRTEKSKTLALFNSF